MGTPGTVKLSLPPLEPLRDVLTHAARAQLCLELEQELIPAILAAADSLSGKDNASQELVQADSATAKAAAEVKRILRTHAVRSACIAGEAAETFRLRAKR